MSPSIFILADDLTGAADSGAQFCGLGKVLLALEPAASEPSDALVLSTDSRGLAASEAAYVVKTALEAAAASDYRWIYKKIDSTLRGNPAAELAALQEALGGARRALIAPAFPTQGRTTRTGIVHVHGARLEETSFGGTGDLGRVFAGRIIPLATVRGGQKVLAERLAGETLPPAGGDEALPPYGGDEALIADAETDSDLDQLAQAGLRAGIGVFCGSAGLAGALARALGCPPPAPLPQRSAQGGVLVVAGSLHPATIAQVKHARAQGAVVIQPGPGFDLRICHSAGVMAGAALVESGTAILATRPPDEIKGYTQSNIAADWLARAARTALKQAPAALLVLTGGDTARAVCRALGCTRLRLGGEVEPGMPWGIMANGDYPGLTVVTKAGGFGGETALEKAMA